MHTRVHGAPKCLVKEKRQLRKDLKKKKSPPRHQYSLNEANRKRWQLLPIATTSKKALNKLEDDIPISQYLSQSAFQLNQACLVKHGGV